MKKVNIFAISILILILSSIVLASTSDINNDGIVNSLDFARVGLYWRQSECGSCGNADLNEDGNVDIYDLGEIAADWLVRSEPVVFPVGAWDFDDGTADDSSGNGHNGTLAGNASIIEDTERGMVLALDGAGDYVDLGNGGWTNPGNHLTIAAWFKVDVFDAQYQTIIAKGLYTYRLGRTTNDNRLQIYMDYDANHNWKAVTGTTAVNVGWHHAAATYDGTNMKLYIDGKQEGGNVALSTLHSDTKNLCIGRNVDSTGRDWQGWIDDVRFYNKVLSDAQIAALAEVKFAISGKVSDSNSLAGVSGVTMSGLPAEPVTDANGNYSAKVEYGWSGTVTPEKDGYIFSPTEKVYSSVTFDQAGQNYTSTKVAAGNPSPDDGSENVPVTQILSWTAGALANTVDVYFGTDFDAVNSRNASVYKGNQSLNSFNPGTLASYATYYWAIDTINNSYQDSPWAGQVWKFTTIDMDLAGCWKLNEGSGTNAIDSSSYGNNGTITGAAWISDAIFGSVLEFDGADYITIPSAAFSTINSQMTITLWQYGDAAIQPQNDAIFEGLNSSGSRILSCNLPWGNGTIFFDAGYSGSTYDRISKAATANQYEGKWNHWAFSKNTSTGQMKIYCNGQLWHSSTGLTKSMSGITTFKIGAKTDGTQNYDGMIYDFRVYKKELSGTAIHDIYISAMNYEASNPSPANGAENMSLNTVLSWTAGYLAGGHNVYFGTNAALVAGRDISVFKGLQSGTTYNPGALQDATIYYWAVDEVNDLYEDSPWMGQVWQFTASDNSLPPMPDDVKCNNTHLMLGNIRGVAFPINWLTVGCDYTQAQIANTCGILHENWDQWSRGKVQMVGEDGTGTQFTTRTVEECAVPYEKKSSNQTLAQSYLADKFNIPNTTIKWFINSGNSTANSGGTTCDTWSMQVFTVTHELGHLFRLGHGVLLKYNADGTYNSAESYGDRTTNEGSVAAGGWNLPNYHRLNWIEENEVAVFHKEDSGTVYRIRNIRKDNPAILAGVVYYMPVTGNRLWISVTNRDTYGEDYIGNKLAITKYVNGWHMTGEMQSTYCIKHMAGNHTDCYGLTYEVVAYDTSANRAWADIRITYNPANETFNKPLIFKPTLKLLQPVTSTQRGKIEVTIEVTNPNPANTVPVLHQRQKLTVANSYDVTQVTALPGIIPGGTTAKAVYTVTSKMGPLSNADAHLTGSFLVAHLYPFEFKIDF